MSWTRGGILGSAALAGVRAGRVVRVAGVRVMHQAPPTARGVHFLTLEDEDGMLNIVVRPEIYKAWRSTTRQASLLVVEGTVQRRDGVTNVVAREVRRLEMG